MSKSNAKVKLWILMISVLSRYVVEKIMGHEFAKDVGSNIRF